MKEDILKVQCPHCKETLRIRKPEKSGRHTYRCPKCSKPFAINIKEESEKPTPEDKSENISDTASETAVKGTKGQILRLYHRRKLRSDKQLPLKVGDNTIGSISEEKPSDIMIKDDYISRRSATINVELAMNNTFKYLFTLNRTTNPAYFNGKQIEAGTSRYMSDGDEFQLGKTKFYVKKCDTL